MLTLRRFRDAALGTTVAFAALASIAPASAASGNQSNWQQSFMGCAAGAAPFFEQTIMREGTKARPLMKIGTMQAWSVPGDDGKPQLQLTTEDGLTIIGRVLGPQGEDISAALLATVPNIPAKDVSARPAGAPVFGSPVSASPATETAAPVTTEASTVVEAATTVPVAGAAVSDSGMTEVGPLAAALAKTAVRPIAAATDTPAWDKRAAAPQPAKEAASTYEVRLPNAAQTPDELLEQTTKFAIWFSLGNPKPGVPVVYMMADPTCPFCAEATRQLRPYIDQGTLDVRLVPMPILSMDAFTTMMSIIQPGQPHIDFLEHEAAYGSSAESPIKMLDPSEFDEQLKAGLYRNAMWFKKNKIGAVPFFLYRDAAGVQTGKGMEGFSPETFLQAAPLPVEPLPQQTAATNREGQ